MMASSRSSVTPTLQHGACCPFSCSTQPGSTEGILTPPDQRLPLPALLDECLEGEGSKHNAHWRWRDLIPRIVLSDGPGDILFPTTEKLEGIEELPEAPPHHGKGKLTTPPFAPGRRNIKKGRKNSAPCDILTREAVGTQSTSDAPCRTHTKLLVSQLLTLHRQGCKPHYPCQSDTGQH